MKTITIPENEYLQMRHTIDRLKKQLELLQDNSFLEKLSSAYRLFFEKEMSAENTPSDTDKSEWYDFVEKFSGCLSEHPIERGNQGNYELREEIL